MALTSIFHDERMWIGRGWIGEKYRSIYKRPADYFPVHRRCLPSARVSGFRNCRFRMSGLEAAVTRMIQPVEGEKPNEDYCKRSDADARVLDHAPGCTIPAFRLITARYIV